LTSSSFDFPVERGRRVVAGMKIRGGKREREKERKREREKKIRESIWTRQS